MTDVRSTCDTHARYDRDCTGCRIRRREYQAAYRSQPKPTKRARPAVTPPAQPDAPPKVAPVAEELAAQLGRLRRMEANDSVYREMLAAAAERHG